MLAKQGGVLNVTCCLYILDGGNPTDIGAHMRQLQCMLLKIHAPPGTHYGDLIPS